MIICKRVVIYCVIEFVNLFEELMMKLLKIFVVIVVFLFVFNVVVVGL